MAVVILLVSGRIAHCAPAAVFPYNLPPPIDVQTSAGMLQLFGGASGYVYGISGTDPHAAKNPLSGQQPFGLNALNISYGIRKPDGLLQFTIEIGPTTSLVPGAPLPKPSLQSFSTGPVNLGFLTLAPSNALQISVGQLNSLEGYESGTAWLNATTFTTALFYVENAQSIGVAASFTKQEFSATVEFGDGFDTNVWNFLQMLAVWSPDPHQAFAVFSGTNLSHTGLATRIYGGSVIPYSRSTNQAFGPYYDNSTLFGAYYEYTWKNINVIPEIQYVYARPDHRVALRKFSSNFGAALFINKYLSPTHVMLGSWIEYFASNGPDDWFISPAAAGLGASVALTWQSQYLFLRPSISLIHLISFSPGAAYGAGQERNQLSAIATVGFTW